MLKENAKHLPERCEEPQKAGMTQWHGREGRFTEWGCFQMKETERTKKSCVLIVKHSNTSRNV